MKSEVGEAMNMLFEGFSNTALTCGKLTWSAFRIVEGSLWKDTMLFIMK